MSLDVFIGTWLGVDRVTLDFGTGLTAPKMLSALAEGASAIVITFDKDMDFMPLPSEVVARILDPAAWVITDTIGTDVVRAVQVEKINSKEVRLFTNFHENTDYEVSIEDVRDTEGNTINPLYNSATFSGSAKLYPSYNDFHTFMGLYTGMQEEEQNYILPDLFPPELQNQDPAPTSMGQDRNTVIEFDLVDDESSVNLSTVLIYVEGALAYRGDLDTFISPFTGGLSARTVIPYGHHFVLDKQQSPYKYGSYASVSVRVVAYDNPYVGTPNLLDETYSFHIEDYLAPVISAQDPIGTGADENSHISFRLSDTGESGVDLSTLDVTVNGQGAISGGTFQPGWNGTSSSIIANGFNGYDVVIDKTSSYGTYEWYTVTVAVRDNENNLLNSSWTFQTRDWLGPLVVPVDPVSGQSNVDVETNIIIDIYDERGVKSNSILIRFDDGGGFITAFEQGGTPQFKGGFNGPNSSITTIPGGYRIVMDLLSDLDYGTTYYVEVTALDPDNNPERLT
jgi:hypothetical protein